MSDDSKPNTPKRVPAKTMQIDAVADDLEFLDDLPDGDDGGAQIVDAEGRADSVAPPPLPPRQPIAAGGQQRGSLAPPDQPKSKLLAITLVVGILAIGAAVLLANVLMGDDEPAPAEPELMEIGPIRVD